MSANSSIEWTDATWNPIRARNKKTGKLGWFCVHASEGCRHCFSARQNVKAGDSGGNGIPYRAQDRQLVDIFLDEKALSKPLHWRRPRKIFVCSMTDLFADFVLDEWIDKMFAVMALCPQHTFQVLTKRAERMRDYCTAVAAGDRTRRWFLGKEDIWPLPNVWLGVSCERQEEADARIPLLLRTPAAVRFISAEPLLSDMDLSKWLYDERRSSLFSPDRAGDISSEGASRRDLAPRRIQDGPCPDLDQGNAKARRNERVAARRVSSDHVSRSRQAKESFSSPDHLDGGKRSPDSSDFGDQSYRRQQAEQQGTEFRDCDQSRERKSFFQARTQDQGSAWRQEFLSGADCHSGYGNTGAMEGQGDEPARDGGALQGQAVHDFRRRDAQELGSPSLDWVIAGGESGSQARPMHPQWARDLRDQCQAAGVPFFFKQWGEWAPGENAGAAPTRTERVASWFNEGWQYGTLTPRVSAETHVDDEPDVYRLGKKAAGRLLDGREWNEFPAVQP